MNGHSAKVNAITFAKDGSIFATASDDQTINLWDAYAGKQLSSFIGHNGAVLSLAFSYDGRWLISGSADCTIKI